jgi:hypothetical protein
MRAMKALAVLILLGGAASAASSPADVHDALLRRAIDLGAEGPTPDGRGSILRESRGGETLMLAALLDLEADDLRPSDEPLLVRPVLRRAYKGVVAVRNVRTPKGGGFREDEWIYRIDSDGALAAIERSERWFRLGAGGEKVYDHKRSVQELLPPLERANRLAWERLVPQLLALVPTIKA